MIKICLHCGQTFTARHGLEGFCSSECRHKHINKTHFDGYHKRHKPPQPKPCAICGSLFQPRHDREIYCSDECRQQRRHDYDVKFYQRKIKGLTWKNLPCDELCLEYLARLETAYGYADDGTIRQTINLWHERRSINGN